MKTHCLPCHSPCDYICTKCHGCEHCCQCVEENLQHRGSREGVRHYRLALRELDQKRKEKQQQKQ